MDEKILVKDIVKKGRFFYRSQVILTINKELSKDEINRLRNRITKVAQDTGEGDKFLEIHIRTPKEFYIHQFNSVLYSGFTDRTEYPNYLDSDDISFLDSMFNRFIEHNGLYLPGTIVHLDVFSTLTKTIGIIKNEIASNSY